MINTSDDNSDKQIVSRRDYKHIWYKANRKKTVHGIIDEYIRFVNVDDDMDSKITNAIIDDDY